MSDSGDIRERVATLETQVGQLAEGVRDGKNADVALRDDLQVRLAQHEDRLDRRLDAMAAQMASVNSEVKTALADHARGDLEALHNIDSKLEALSHVQAAWSGKERVIGAIVALCLMIAATVIGEVILNLIASNGRSG